MPAPTSSRFLLAAHGLLALAMVAWSCKGDEPKDDVPTDIPDDSGVLGSTPVPDDTGYAFPADTFDGGGLDETPDNLLEVRHSGYWDMTPVGGPYETVIGTLDIDELIDGEVDQQFCRVRYALTGFGIDTSATGGCPGCDVVFDVEFFSVEEGGFQPYSDAEPIDTGGTYDDRDLYEVKGHDECRSPDLPEDGEHWQMGWSEDEGLIYVNYYGSDTWLPFYAGEQELDRVAFAWVESFGFVVPEEED